MNDDRDAAVVRRIVHIDMDAFYASVEQRDHPELRGLPVAVGGSSQRGVVAAASYEARRYGVHSAMASVTAARRCPDLIFVRPRFEAYRKVSQQIHAIFASYTPLIEPLSLDEAYLDLTDQLPAGKTASQMAAHIRADIRRETGLSASAGISYCKFLAKIASDQNKPDGQFVIPPQHGPDFVTALPVGKFHGVGPATVAKMARLGITTGADLRSKPMQFLQQHFGKSGRWYYNISRGIDDRPVRMDRIRKSIGAETTFSEDLHQVADGKTALEPLAEKVWSHATRHEAQGRTVVLKVKFADFRIQTRSYSLNRPFRDQSEFLSAAQAMLALVMPDPRGVRLLGVTLSGLGRDTDDKAGQLDLFD